MTSVQVAGVDSRLCEIGDIVKLVEVWEAHQLSSEDHDGICNFSRMADQTWVPL